MFLLFVSVMEQRVLLFACGTQTQITQTQLLLDDSDAQDQRVLLCLKTGQLLLVWSVGHNKRSPQQTSPQVSKCTSCDASMSLLINEEEEAGI